MSNETVRMKELFGWKENPNHDPHSGEFASGPGGGSTSSGGPGGSNQGANSAGSGQTFQRGFSAKFAEQVSKQGLKPHNGTIYASTGLDVAHYYGLNQALVKDKSSQYAIVTFKSGSGARVYPNDPASKPGPNVHVTQRADTFYKFNKTIPPADIVDVKVYEVNPHKPGKPKLVQTYKDDSGEGEFYAAAVINEDGELEYLGPHRETQ